MIGERLKVEGGRRKILKSLELEVNKGQLRLVEVSEKLKMNNEK